MLSAADRALLDQLLALGQTGDHNTGDEDGYDEDETYMQKTCDFTEKAILAKKNLRKKCVNRDKM